MATPRRIVISYIGRPLSGKTTSLLCLARAHSAEISTRTPGGIDRELICTWRDSIDDTDISVELRCCSGAVWQGALPKLQAATSDALIVMIDPNVQVAESQREFLMELDAALRTSSFDPAALVMAVQINKRDLVPSPEGIDSLLHGLLFESAPRFTSSALECDGLEEPLRHCLTASLQRAPITSLPAERATALSQFDPFDPARQARTLPVGRIAARRQSSLRRATWMLLAIAALLFVSGIVGFRRGMPPSRPLLAILLGAGAALGANWLSREGRAP